MPLIPGYDYDIFISYAHVDNIAYPGQAAGWIQQFYTNLDIMMAKRFGRLGAIKIWWDTRKLDGSILFDQSIQEGIQKSAIMICLNSPGYLQSSYCQQELDLFYHKAQAEKTGLKVGDRLRILNVLLNNIPFKQWPHELNGVSGFPFYAAKGPEDFGDPLDTLSNDFRTQMQNVRDAVWNLLSDFSLSQSPLPATAILVPDVAAGAAAPSASAPSISISPTGTLTGTAPVATPAFTVFVGEVADTLRPARKRIVTEIEKQGFTVVTGIPPPDEALAHESAAQGAIQQSQLSVHLFDQYAGREISGDDTLCYPQKQAELALETERPKMIWVPDDIDIAGVEDPTYKGFLQQLESGHAKGGTYEFVRGSKSAVAQQIIDYANQLQIKRQQKPAETGKLSVLVDTHFSDQLYALDLSKALLENQIQPFVNPQEDDPRKNINLLADRISQVKKLIFLYGTVSKEWILERMSAAVQLIINNDFPIDQFFVYLAPPHKEATDLSLKQKCLRINIFDSSNNSALDAAALQRFFTELKGDSA